MNVRLSRDFEFSAILASARYETPVINHYTVSVRMAIVSDHSDQYNTAYQRMKFWFDLMSNSVLIEENHEHLSAWAKTAARIMMLPEEPCDQIIGMMLFCKLQAICEDTMQIQEVSITSAADDYITYYHDMNEALGPLAVQGWWHDSSPNHVTAQSRRRGSGKVISLDRPMEWKDVDLDWDNESDATSSVVFADFARDDNKPSK